MAKAVIISGLLDSLSENIIPIIKNKDVYVHTWYNKENERWINKLSRFKKYTTNLYITVDEPKYESKLFSHFYSTWKAFNIIQDASKYNLVVKLKPNLETEKIEYQGNIEDYFYKAYISNRPLLNNYTYKDCMYGSIYYKTIDERFFSGHPLVFEKIFRILEEELDIKMQNINQELSTKYGNYEGSLFWTKWFDNLNIPIIQDTDLVLPNNIRSKYETY